MGPKFTCLACHLLVHVQKQHTTRSLLCSSHAWSANATTHLSREATTSFEGNFKLNIELDSLRTSHLILIETTWKPRVSENGKPISGDVTVSPLMWILMLCDQTSLSAELMDVNDSWTADIPRGTKFSYGVKLVHTVHSPMWRVTRKSNPCWDWMPSIITYKW